MCYSTQRRIAFFNPGKNLKNIESCISGLKFFFLQGVLTSEPISRANKSFHSCVKILLNTASDETPENAEKRTHCMNVLRAIFRNNQLGELVSQYVASAMIVAITGLKSAVWGVSFFVNKQSLVVKVSNFRFATLRRCCMQRW